MLIRKPDGIPSSLITPKDQYINRRRFLKGAALAGAGALGLDRLANIVSPRARALAGTKLETVKSPITTTGEQLTSLEDITHYNNFYEFGVDKGDPAKNAGALPTRPWTIKVEGKVKTPKTFDIDQLMKLRPLEDRVYRHRCVEGWSMVIPWVGYSLSEFIKECDPLPSAKYVQFLSYFNSHIEKWYYEDATIVWPYSEGLRMDEAMNPLTLLPWKYGFKSIKSVVTVKFVEKEPHTTWNDQASNEYGFYSNVNPNHDHPRWSQKTERRIGLPFYQQRRQTLMFNGYSDFVASMYQGMDLNKYF